MEAKKRVIGNSEIWLGDSLETLKQLPDQSVNCCVTSPPYWGLRDYGVRGQLGLENTPEEYVDDMVKIFSEVRRVLRLDGTLWLNLGDSYASNGGDRTIDQALAKTTLHNPFGNLKFKDLVGIPWMVAFALRSDGWYLRSDIIWAKPNPMPESVTDRPTKAHEYLFLLSKSTKYFYDADAIKERAIYFDDDRQSMANEKRNGIRPIYKDARSYDGKYSDKQRGHVRRHAGFNDRWDNMTKQEQCSAMRNKRSVWTVPTKPFSGAHFATFPEKLITPCILAGCPEGGVVLDPFGGSGTSGIVAVNNGRKAILIELNPSYVDMASRRIEDAQKQGRLF